MGFESIIFGSISLKAFGIEMNDLLKQAQDHLETLPLLVDDNWPFLPREVFSISSQPNETTKKISYESILVHFGLSVKQLDEDLDNWLNKYELFMKSMPGAWESIVHIKIVPYTGGLRYNHLSYWWYKTFVPKTSDAIWNYEGDKRDIFKVD